MATIKALAIQWAVRFDVLSLLGMGAFFIPRKWCPNKGNQNRGYFSRRSIGKAVLKMTETQDWRLSKKAALWSDGPRSIDRVFSPSRDERERKGGPKKKLEKEKAVDRKAGKLARGG